MADPDRTDDGRLRIARIVGVHGVQGAVRLKLFLDDAGRLDDFGPITDRAGQVYDIALGHPQKGHWVARIDGVEDRDRAQALRDTDLFVAADTRPVLDEGEFYAADLIGMAVVDPAGKPLGRVAAVEDFGAGPLLEVARRHGAPVLFPFTAAVVPAVDPSRRVVTIDPPPGYLDEGTAAAKPAGGASGDD